MTDIEKLIVESANNLKTMLIAYQDKKGAITKREIEPYELKGDSIYAYCRNKKGIRRFKLDGILFAMETRNKYDPKWEIKTEK